MGEYGRYIHLHDLGHPDVHKVHKQLRMILDSYPGDRTSVSEVHEFDYDEWASYYGRNLDEFHMPFNFHLMVSDWTAEEIRRTVEGVLGAVPPGAPLNWLLGNHDERRIATRLGPENTRLAALLLLTLPGAAFLYYGDELGMVDGNISEAASRDPWGDNVSYLSRDGCRTPMQWTGQPGTGFTDGKPWLPIANGYKTLNVEAQLAEGDSTINLYRAILAERRKSDALRSGAYETHPASNADLFVYERRASAQTVLVALNLSDRAAELDMTGARLILSTNPDRDSENPLVLAPREGVLLESPG